MPKISTRWSVALSSLIVWFLLGCSSSVQNASTSNPTPVATPTVTSISPSKVGVGSGPVTLTVTGANFTAANVIQISGTAVATTFVSSTQLTAVVPAAQFNLSGQLAITVSGAIASVPVSIEVDNPQPTITTLAPSTVTVGSSGNTVTITGTNFVTSSIVQANGTARTTTYISGTQLSFQLTAADMAAAGNINIAIVNPQPGGGTTATSPISVAQGGPAPVLSSVSPNQFYVGSPDSIITLYGTNIFNKSVAQWNGMPLATVSFGTCMLQFSYVPCLRASVPASYLAAVATATMTLNTATSTPSGSNSLTVTVSYPPVPTLTSLSVAGGPVNQPVSITLTGSGFTSLSTVTLNGVTVPSVFVSGTSLTANVPASIIATPNVYSLSVTTPSPGGGTSTPMYYTAYVPVTNNSMVYNPANGLFYLSVPSTAGAPYGNSIVSVDPVTGNLGTPIPVGSEPNRLAITSDGKYLWVALDGASAVRKVDLTAGTALYEFPIDVPGASQYTVASLAALPGSPDSVVVSTYYGGYTEPTGEFLAIFDGGVARPTKVSFATYASFPWTMIVNGATNEIYGPGTVFPEPYVTYSYDSTGVSTKSSTNNSNLTYAANNTDDVQLVGGTLYTSYGMGVDAETGTKLGSFYSSGTTPAQGSIAVDSAQAKAFILNGYSDYADSGVPLQNATLYAFNTADYSITSDTPIPLVMPQATRGSYQYAGPTGPRLTRWGSNGLAFRDTGGFVSLHANLVKNLSTVNADLAVNVAAPASATTGANAAYSVTIQNNGPSSATAVSLVSTIPSSGVLVAATPSAGACNEGTSLICNLGSMASGASVQVAVTVQILNPGPATLGAQVSALETDPSLANNSASATVAVGGVAYNPVPTFSVTAPAGIRTGSSDTQITLTGTGFTAGSTVQLNGTTIQTTFVSSTQLTATVPAASLSTIGWAGVSVTNPLPGGGASGTLPLYIFSALQLSANHILYDPYSRKLFATIGTGTSTLAGNSLVSVTPETGSVGTPVVLAGTPTSMAESFDGQFLYAMLPSATTPAISRYNLLTHQPDFNATGFQITGYNQGLRDLATIPGSPNALAVDEGEYPGSSIFDFDSVNKVATRRGAATGTYTGTCLTAPDPSRLFIVDLYSSGSVLKSYNVGASGLVDPNGFNLYGAALVGMNCTKADGNYLFGQAGGVASLTGALPTQTGTFEGMPYVSNYASGIKDFAPDASLSRSFFLTSANPNGYSSIFDSVTAFDLNTYMRAASVPLPFQAIEGQSGFTGVDVFRWGQDGLALLSSSGTVYLLRGPVVVPGLLSGASPPVLSGTPTTLAHGMGNTQITVTGTNFLPGMAVQWNGTYRTTTVLSPTQASVFVPASDLISSGTASLSATNPGATQSSSINAVIQ